MFQRPPGLMAAPGSSSAPSACAAGTPSFRTMPFPLEWTTVALVVVAITFGERLALATVMTPQAPMALTMIQMGLTMLVYPLVVGLAYLGFGLSRPAPGAVDSLGHRL